MTNVEIIVHNNHWRITASTLTLNFNNGEFTIVCCGPGFYSTQVTAYRVQNLRGAAQHAWGGGTDLHEILADWFTVPVRGQQRDR